MKQSSRIAVVYGDQDTFSARFAKEVIVNEAACHRFEDVKRMKNVVRVNGVRFEFVNASKKKEWVNGKKKYDKIYCTEQVMDEEILKQKTERIVYHPEPDFSIVDYVHDVYRLTEQRGETSLERDGEQEQKCAPAIYGETVSEEDQKIG
ncbi:hypothetical protein IMZ31_23330 (plasmid) [Pontibacillus sp. ALD_SL1]|uniref:hypothetical protein n=1 Tax=Pontibacillus sp. ALD_SL1 TaxID=2777185 RepID=UPI001A97B7F9|nr:hypothetical protein [Pontibacillus sp. ALD_SL1]QST02385.1 hypothetical protein IMZ31_23330 [Pontibacillus sp. ALD_SL1]